MPEAYERLLLDTLIGDASLFARSDEVELAWGIIDPILKTWQETNLPEVATTKPAAGVRSKPRSGSGNKAANGWTSVPPSDATNGARVGGLNSLPAWE